jgi:hypothetical protein
LRRGSVAELRSALGVPKSAESLRQGMICRSPRPIASKAKRE